MITLLNRDETKDENAEFWRDRSKKLKKSGGGR
jgi:hypothetical protein